MRTSVYMSAVNKERAYLLVLTYLCRFDVDPKHSTVLEAVRPTFVMAVARQWGRLSRGGMTWERFLQAKFSWLSRLYPEPDLRAVCDCKGCSVRIPPGA